MHSGVLLWQSNFSNKAALDEHWNTEVVGIRHNNNELQRYSDDSFRFDNNELVITMSKNGNDIKSGRINTKGKLQIQYGYIEALIKFTGYKGLCPAFRMLGNSLHWPDCGEIDIMEWVGWNDSAVYGTLHGPGYCGGNAYGSGGKHITDRPLSNEYHKYAIEWKPDSIKWFFNDQLFFEANRNGLHHCKGNCHWTFNDRSFYLLLNFAVGGNFGGAFPNSENYIYQQLPQNNEFHISYIKIYKTHNGYGALV